MVTVAPSAAGVCETTNGTLIDVHFGHQHAHHKQPENRRAFGEFLQQITAHIADDIHPFAKAEL